jgi:predicted DNA-binding transcriptional regulator YafY
MVRDGPQVDPGLLAVLAACCRDLEIVAFGYSGRGREPSQRRVEPHRLVTFRGRWYLLAFDPSRADWRNFRVDRISDVAPTRHHFLARELPAADAASYLAESFATASYRHSVRIEVELPAAAVRSTFFGLIPGQLEPAGEDSCVLRITADSPSLLIQYVAGVVALGAPYTLEASPELAQLIDQVGRQMMS